MIADKSEYLAALVEESWMYRALKMEFEIEALREEIVAMRQAQQRANDAIFDRLHDIAEAVDVRERQAPPLSWNHHFLAATQNQGVSAETLKSFLHTTTT